MLPRMFDLFSLELWTGPGAFSGSLNQFLEIPGTFPDNVPLQTYQRDLEVPGISVGHLKGESPSCMSIYENADVAYSCG